LLTLYFNLPLNEQVHVASYQQPIDIASFETSVAMIPVERPAV